MKQLSALLLIPLILSIGIIPQLMPEALATENTVIATISVGTTPEGVAFDSANDRMYVANYNDDTVSVINTATNSVIATVSVGDGPRGIVFDSGNGHTRMYVANYNDDTVSVINTATNSVIATVSVGNGPLGVAFNSANNRIWVVNELEHTVTVIETGLNSIDATISVGTTPADMAFDSTNDRMYVVNSVDDTVSVVNTITNNVDATVSVGDGPRGVAFDSTNDRMYVANWNDSTVSVIDTGTNTVIATISVGNTPRGVAFDSTNDRMYVANWHGDTVSVIDTATNTVIATVSVGNTPVSLAFDSANNRMYVANYLDDTVSVIDTTPSVSSSSECYDCIHPELQESQIIISSENYTITTSDEPTHITANVGDVVNVTLKITDNKSVNTIPFAALYTNYQEKPSDMSAFYANNFDNLKQISTSFYEWNVRADDVPYDYDGTVSWSENFPTVVTDVLTEDNFKFKNDDNTLEYFMMPFTFTMNQPMDATSIVAKVYDASGNRMQVTLPVTLEIIPKENVILSDNEEIATLDKGDVIVTPSEDTIPLLNESILFTVLAQWSGYSQVTSDDAEVLSVMGLQGDSLPAWTKNLGEWVIQEKLDVSELIMAIEYVNNQ